MRIKYAVCMWVRLCSHNRCYSCLLTLCNTFCVLYLFIYLCLCVLSAAGGVKFSVQRNNNKQRSNKNNLMKLQQSKKKKKNKIRRKTLDYISRKIMIYNEISFPCHNNKSFSVCEILLATSKRPQTEMLIPSINPVGLRFLKMKNLWNKNLQ